MVDKLAATSKLGSIKLFELASVFDLAGVRAPKRSCLNMCQWVYKSAECGYRPGQDPGKTVNGVTFKFFNINNEPIVNEVDDICGKKLNSCRCRFGERDLPFGGFPSIGSQYA